MKKSEIKDPKKRKQKRWSIHQDGDPRVYFYDQVDARKAYARMGGAKMGLTLEGPGGKVLEGPK